MTRLSLAAIAFASLALTACGGGPSESDLASSCKAQKEAKPEECECIAREAKARMSDKGFQAFALSSMGKSAEAEAITKDMPAQEQAAFIGSTIEIMGKCMLGTP